jgi:hypothetical protein
MPNRATDDPFAHLHTEFPEAFDPRLNGIERLDANLHAQDPHANFQLVQRGNFATMTFPPGSTEEGLVANLDSGLAMVLRANTADGSTVAALAHPGRLPGSEDAANAIWQRLQEALIDQDGIEHSIRAFVVGGSDAVPGRRNIPVATQVDQFMDVMNAAQDFGLTGGLVPARNQELLQQHNPAGHVAQVFVNASSIGVRPALVGRDEIAIPTNHPAQVALPIVALPITAPGNSQVVFVPLADILSGRFVLPAGFSPRPPPHQPPEKGPV